MKKSIGLIALFAFFLLTVSAHTERLFEAAEGYSAPLFKIETADSAVSLTKLNPNGYVLLTFWDSTNPETRIGVNRHESIAAGSEGRLKLLAINVDSNYRLFNNIRKADGLTEGVHVNLQGSNLETVSRLYHLDQGLNSFLIDPAGKIVAVNPDDDTLKSL